MTKKLLSGFVFIIAMMFTTGCIWNEEISASEIGLVTDAGAIQRCESPGLVSDSGFWTDLQKIRVDTLTFPFGNNSVATKDTQIVSVNVTVQVRRSAACQDAIQFYSQWPQLMDDAKLMEAVAATGGEAIKNGVRQFTLDQLLNDRDGLATAIRTALQEDADTYYTTIVNVIVNDVDVDDEYERLLSEKAKLTVQIETENRRQDLVKASAQAAIIEQQQQVEILKAQLLKEQAQTAIQLEISRRQSESVQAQWQVYLDNPEALRLRQLELYQGIVGPGTKWVFVPQGSSVDSILTEDLIPVIK